MALIKCPDCGRDVSDSAPACLGCGRPRATEAEATTKDALIGAGAILFVVVGIYALWRLYGPDPTDCDNAAVIETASQNASEILGSAHIAAISAASEVSYDKPTRTRKCIGTLSLIGNPVDHRHKVSFVVMPTGPDSETFIVRMDRSEIYKALD